MEKNTPYEHFWHCSPETSEKEIMSDTYYDSEMEKLEKQQAELRKQQENNTRDRINTITQPVSIHDYQRIVNADIQIAPTSGQSLKQYIAKIEIFRDINYRNNWETHVDNGRKTWYTHKRPQCFMCADQVFITTLMSVLKVIAKQNPKIKF